MGSHRTDKYAKGPSDRALSFATHFTAVTDASIATQSHEMSAPVDGCTGSPPATAWGELTRELVRRKA